MTYWQMNGKIASVNEAISPNVNRRFTYGIVFPSNGTLQFVALCRINRPERCEHGHAIAASELLIDFRQNVRKVLGEVLGILPELPDDFSDVELPVVDLLHIRGLLETWIDK